MMTQQGIGGTLSSHGKELFVLNFARIENNCINKALDKTHERLTIRMNSQSYALGRLMVL